MKKILSIIFFCLGCYVFLEAQNVWKPIDGTGILGVGPDGSIFAYSENGKLARSQNEGETWEQVNGNYMHQCIAFSPQGRIFVSPASYTYLLYSDDGGDTWQQTTIMSSCAMNDIGGIYAVSNDIVVVWSLNGEMYYTLDGGMTWGFGGIEIDEYHQVGDLIVNEAGDVYASKWYYSGEDSGIFHSSLSDMQNWELVAFDGAAIHQMEFDPDGNIVAGALWGSLGGFQHEPGFYLIDGQTIAVSDNGIVYHLRYNYSDYTAVLNYSTDHGEHFFDIGEVLPTDNPAPGGGSGASIFKGHDNHLYFHGNGQYYKSVRDADHILENFLVDNTRWAIYYQNLYLDWAPYIQIGIKGDTIVDGITYHKVIKCTSYGTVIDGDCFGGIRVEADGKWYFRLFSEENVPQYLSLDMEPNTERLVYDFSLSVCDRFNFAGYEYEEPEYWMSVFDIDEIEINGSIRKRLWFDYDCEEGDHPHNWNWIEGIGSNYGLLYSIQAFPLDGSSYHLGEVYQDGELIYSDPYFHNYIPLIDEANNRQKWNVVYIGSMNYPNDYHTEIQSIRDNINLDGVDYKLVWTENVYQSKRIAGAVREENKKVYFRRYWQQSYQNEVLLYDFNLTVGDTVTVGWGNERLIVLEESQVQVQGTMRRQLGLAMYYGDGATREVEEYWIEGIGSTYGFLNSGYEGFVGSFVHLLCYHEDDEVLWMNEDFSSCTMNSDTGHIPFAPQGAEWYFNVDSFMGSPVSYYRMAVEGDTVIQGRLCKIITQPYLGGNGDKQYVYEDNRVVYWYNQTLQQFTVLYVFRANAGESWTCQIDSCSYEIRVESVEVVNWNGHRYRVQNVVSDSDEYGHQPFYGAIIEGIGYEKGLFPYPWACSSSIYCGSYTDYLRCYLVDGEMRYHGGDYDCEEKGYCWDGTVAESYAGGDGTAENPYQIATSQQLALLAQQTNNGTGGDAYYVLTNNISLASCNGGVSFEWTPIGMPIITANGSTLDTVLRYFTGHFDGQGRSVYGLRQIIENGWFEPVGGLFGCTDGAEIRNVCLSSCHISGNGEYVGGLVGHAGLTDIHNCSINQSSIKTEWGVAGGLVGYAGLPFARHGASDQNSRISSCSMQYAVTVNGSDGAGGIVGQVNEEHSQVLYEITNCSCMSYYDLFGIQSSSAAGGIVGSMVNGTITDCSNEYKVTGGGNHGTGGIVGEAKQVTISNCTNGNNPYYECGAIEGEYACGGIVGRSPSEWISNPHLDVIACENYGTVTGHNTTSGTLVGGIVGAYASNIIRCFNKGNITATVKYSGAAGGITGNSLGTIANCFNRGDVTTALDESADDVGWLFAGGIAGTPDSRIYNVYNTGDVLGPDLSAFPDVLVGYGNIIGYGIEGCRYFNAYWLNNDLPACGHVNEPELHGSSAFHSGMTSTQWQLNEAQYGTTNLLDALNLGTAMVFDSMSNYPYLCSWQEDIDNSNEGFPIFSNIVIPCPFVGTEWYYEIQNDDGSITFQHLAYAADTTVNNKDVKVIIRTNTLYDKHKVVTHEYVYEEFGKVYWWNKTLEEFTVLYDYAAETGDEWTIAVGNESIVMHVDTVEQCEYEGRMFKMLQVSDADGLFSGNILCGVGHLASFFPERLMTRGKNYRVEGIRCYWRNGELVFKQGDRDCDEVYEQIHNGLNEMDNAAFAVYPNPTDGVLFIRTHAVRPYEEYRITNLMGQTVLSGNLNTENQQINVSNLPQGMYFFTLGGATRKFVVR